jgi:two-component system, NtrC family, response regulator AtoC
LSLGLKSADVLRRSYEVCRNVAKNEQIEAESVLSISLRLLKNGLVVIFLLIPNKNQKNGQRSRRMSHGLVISRSQALAKTSIEEVEEAKPPSSGPRLAASDVVSSEELDGHLAYVAESPAMREVRKQVGQVANIDVPVLILGESGTGKEVVARLIHKLSGRSTRKFLKVNCAALPVELLESELFGYEAGAFTGARQSKAGKFESCHKGTIMLDEIAEMPISPQAKLLHVLQDGEFSRLGNPTPTRVDVRVLAATNVDITGAIQSGKFRADLYYRLNAFTIHLPPLRERKEDIPLLLTYFMNTWAERYGRWRLPISKRMIEVCRRYSWPGNVRELENFVKRYLVLHDEQQVLDKLAGPEHGSSAQLYLMQKPGAQDCSDLKSLIKGLKREAERAAIIRALEQTNGNRQETAAQLNISLRALHYKIRQYGIGPLPTHPVVIDRNQT